MPLFRPSQWDATDILGNAIRELRTVIDNGAGTVPAVINWRLAALEAEVRALEKEMFETVTNVALLESKFTNFQSSVDQRFAEVTALVQTKIGLSEFTYFKDPDVIENRLEALLSAVPWLYWFGCNGKFQDLDIHQQVAFRTTDLVVRTVAECEAYHETYPVTVMQINGDKTLAIPSSFFWRSSYP